MQKVIQTLIFIIITGFSSGLAQENPNLTIKEFQLENGLKVFLNEDQSVNKVFGAVAVNAGSKQDPADATGIAHYLEHLLFKGTTEMGTWDYEAEKPHLDEINALYDELGKTTDPEARAEIQLKINEQSRESAQYGLPNEFDNLLKSIGSTRVNAFTSPDMTFYHNSFPPNQVHKWLDIYAHRFQEPVFRSFQSELEVVYEEKNRSMDNFQFQIFEEFSKHLYPGHPYGTQVTLGSVEHLKNPSLTKMYQFFKDYYVANNMALILCGNFDAEAIEPVIREKFGKLKRGTVPEFPEYPISKFEGRKYVKIRMTPINVGILGFKTVPQNHPDRAAIDVFNYLVSNENQTGSLDKALLENELMAAGLLSFPYVEDGASVIFYIPKILVQSLGSGEKVVTQALGEVAQGNFSDENLLAAQNSLNREFQKSLEDPTDRGNQIGQAFIQGQNWAEFTRHSERIASISREDILRVGKSYYGEDFLAIWSKMGFPPKTKLTKPPYEPVLPDQTKSSSYAEQFKTLKELDKQPKFLDFEKDVTTIDFDNGSRLYVTENPINDIYQFEIKYNTGSHTYPELAMATRMMNYAGTKDKSLSQIKEAFDQLGSTYSIQSDERFTTVRLSGLESQQTEAIELLGQLLKGAEFSEKSRKLTLNDFKTERRLEKRDPTSMGKILVNFAVHQENSNFLRRLSQKEMKKWDLDKLKSSLQSAMASGATIHYSGNVSAETVKKQIKTHIPVEYTEENRSRFQSNGVEYAQNKIYFVNDPKAVQSQVYFYVSGDPYRTEDYPRINAFNSYFGGGFSGLILQEIREFRSLAYSAGGKFAIPYLPNENGKLITYIGCQADKTPEAMAVMMDLLKDMPQKPERMEMIRNNLRHKAFSDYPDFRNRSKTIQKHREIGLDEDQNKTAYPVYETMDFEAIHSVYVDMIMDQPIVIAIYGDKEKVDLEGLKKYGEVVELKVGEIGKW